MPVEVGEWAAGAFIALFAAFVVIIVAYYMRRNGRLESRGAKIAVGALVAVLILYGFGAPAILPLLRAG
jgi:hypothetical protein